ncbi:hypothetical protein [Acinetobacter piscicola]|uniref:hypothetical protein n=1 Tax=Acinetobacter piscicola TaxID=2006115 RepID=UPI0010226507|nr:hypothetical protein [Acinetobacter piscicola]RYL25308.1 hypothetical protein EWP19_12415 [Acinetobacter piscicola]
MTDTHQNSDLHHSNLTSDTSNPQSSVKKSRFSPTIKGVLIGAAAGSILPIFGTFSGAVIGGIAGKVYEKKYCSHKA